MKRPQHSPSAFRWYMQMSTNRLFILVEGKETDPFFYSQLLRPVCHTAGIPCDVINSNFVSGEGGKKTLIDLYLSLHSVSSLVQGAGTSRRACIFYLDKDVDDLMGKLIRSPHVVYTPHYCVENLLFIYGTLVIAAAAASSLDPTVIAPSIPNSDQWRRQKAELWKQFVILCLLSHWLGLNCECHYGRMVSPLNVPAEAPTNQAQAAAIESDLQTRAHLTFPAFNLKLRAVTRYVENRFRLGLHDTVFNGKWYVELLRREIHAAAAGAAYHSPANNTLLTGLMLTLDFEAQWAEHFRQPMRVLIQATGL